MGDKLKRGWADEKAQSLPDFDWKAAPKGFIKEWERRVQALAITEQEEYTLP